MAKTDNKSIFFLTLSFICIWVILDNIFGRRYLDTFLSNIFPFYKISNSANSYDTEKNSIKNTAPVSKFVDKVVDTISPDENSTTHKVLDKVGDSAVFTALKNLFTKFGGMAGGAMYMHIPVGDNELNQLIDMNYKIAIAKGMSEEEAKKYAEEESKKFADAYNTSPIETIVKSFTGAWSKGKKSYNDLKDYFSLDFETEEEAAEVVKRYMNAKEMLEG